MQNTGCRAWASVVLQHKEPAITSLALGRFNTCVAEWLCDMWDLAGSEIEPVSSALEGRFFPLKNQEALQDYF